MGEFFGIFIGNVTLHMSSKISFEEKRLYSNNFDCDIMKINVILIPMTFLSMCVCVCVSREVNFSNFIFQMMWYISIRQLNGGIIQLIYLKIFKKLLFKIVKKLLTIQ